MRNLLLVLTPLLLIGCTARQPQSQELTDYIPQEAGLLLKLDNPDLFFSNIKNNQFIKNNQDHPLSAHLGEQLGLLQKFPHKEAALLAFSATGKDSTSFSFISKATPELQQLDSLGQAKIETEPYQEREIIIYSLEGQVTYSAIVDSIFIASDSKELLKESLDEKRNRQHPQDFERALKAASNKTPSIFINHQKGGEIAAQLFPGLDLELFGNFSNWTALDADLSQTAIRLNGISTATDTLPKLLNVFQDVAPVQNELATVTPDDSHGFLSLGFEDFTPLNGNLNRYNNTTPSEMDQRTKELLQASTEAGMIYFEEAAIFALRPVEVLGAAHGYSAGMEVVEEFREISIYEQANPQAFESAFEPLLSAANLKYFLVLDQFLLFSEDLELLKEVVTQFQNKNTVSETQAYQETLKSLSSESSLLKVSINQQFREKVSEAVAPAHQAATAALELREYPLTALQLVYQSDYAHVHAVLEKTNGSSTREGISQEASVNLDAPLATAPVFFSNHRSKGLDIAVQDQDNTLYLLSNKGKIFWKKQLDTRILGKIREVDLYKNGRIQLAFATQNKLHVIDRNGNEVKPFPLEFRDEITQPLALFDYANTRNYRFVIVQGKEVYMFNSKGQRVKGFKFNKAAEEIVQPPKHIRLGNKDYILIAEASGRLNILNRRGDNRVPLKENFSFSENEWFEYNNQFVSTNSGGELIKIDQRGNISRENLNLKEGHKIAVTPKTLVTISENELSIKGNTQTLDYGIYSEPLIFYLNNKLYISVTDLQASRVYLFDSSGQLLPHFPVYGNSVMDLGNADADRRLELTVQGGDEEVLLYEVPR